MKSSPKLRQMLVDLEFEQRFKTQRQHRAWLQTPEALAEILKHPGKAIWPVDAKNWNKE